MNRNIASKLFLGGKSLEELNFPEEWEYDFDMSRWFSEEHTIEVSKGLSKKRHGKKWSEPKEQYLYITDEMLAKTKDETTT